MKYYTIVLIICILLWTNCRETNAAETRQGETNPPLLNLNFYVKSKVNGDIKNVDEKIESIRILDQDTIIIVCTTKNVHMWDGNIDLQKFKLGMRDIRGNLTGFFTSTVSMRLRESPIQDFSSSKPSSIQTYVKCFGLDKEEDETSKCIYLNPIEDGKPEHLDNVNETRVGISVAVNSCPQTTTTELENAEIPEWLWNAENNSAVCHVDSPSRMQLKSVNCENPSWCNMNRFCTAHTCPFFVVTVPPCQRGCNRQSMDVNYLSGQLQCEANGFRTQLNFGMGFNSEMCYYKPRGSVSICQVLDLDIPDADIFHGFPLKLYGRASKFVIIQKPEVHIILSNGTVFRPNVHIASEDKLPYYKFMINETADSNTKLIKIIGHRYDSCNPVVIKKQIHIKVGVPPKITGLPNELNLLKNDAIAVLPFGVVGLPDPKFVLSLDGLVLSYADHRFNVFEGRKGYKYLKVDTISGSVSGMLEISARNIFGKYSCTLVIKDTFRLSNTEAYMVAAVLAVLFILVPSLFFSAVFKLCDRFRRGPISV